MSPFLCPLPEFQLIFSPLNPVFWKHCYYPPVARCTDECLSALSAMFLSQSLSKCWINQPFNSRSYHDAAKPHDRPFPIPTVFLLFFSPLWILEFVSWSNLHTGWGIYMVAVHLINSIIVQEIFDWKPFRISAQGCLIYLCSLLLTFFTLQTPSGSWFCGLWSTTKCCSVGNDEI